MNLKQKILRYYLHSNGKAPIIEWLEKLRDKVVRTRINRRLERMALGHYGDCKERARNNFPLSV
jgi:putative component of toxin-antitoxin plasmid stabilization module